VLAAVVLAAAGYLLGFGGCRLEDHVPPRSSAACSSVVATQRHRGVRAPAVDAHDRASVADHGGAGAAGDRLPLQLVAEALPPRAAAAGGPLHWPVVGWPPAAVAAAFYASA
jgi:hypothetical protein